MTARLAKPVAAAGDRPVTPSILAPDAAAVKRAVNGAVCAAKALFFQAVEAATHCARPGAAPSANERGTRTNASDEMGFRIFHLRASLYGGGPRAAHGDAVKNTSG